MAHSLIIGGSKGLGKAVARKFRGRGDSVSVISRTTPDDKIEGVDYWEADLEKPDSVLEVLSKVVERQKVTYVVFAQRYRGNEDSWEGEFAVSLTSTKVIIEYLRNHFSTSERSIVLISSVFSEFVGDNQPLSYHLAKAGLDSIARFFAANLGKENIRVNAVTPFTFIKDESRGFYEKQLDLLNMYKAIVPLGRLGEADEIADCILFFCSPNSRYVSGQNLYVDGGLSVVWGESVAKSALRI